MKNKSRIYLAAFGCIIILCVAGILWQKTQGPKEIAEIYLDGALVRQVHWASLTETIEIPVGEGNILCADGAGVWMKHADCPDQLCVKQGKISSGSLSIVCLPNRVTVSLKNAPEGGLDGIAG